MVMTSGTKTDPVAALAAALAFGTARIVDLSKPLGEATPMIKLPAHLPQYAQPRFESISSLDSGISYSRTIIVAEHAGTHFDAPIHWKSGAAHANAGTDTIPVDAFIRPAVVIDVSAKAAADDNYLASAADLEAFEANHGRIPEGAWVLLRTDWSKRDHDAYLNVKANGMNTPGPAPDFIRFILARGAIGFGTEVCGTDAGQAFHLDPPMPAHTLMHAANRYGMSGLVNLDQLPPTGAMLIGAPLKLDNGSGSPIRALAIIPA